MSIIHTFDPNSEAILNPWDMVAPVENLPETIIAVYNPKFIGSLEQICVLEECAVLKCNGCARPIYRFEYKEQTLGIFHTMLGGAASAAMLDELEASGVDVVFQQTAQTLLSSWKDIKKSHHF